MNDIKLVATDLDGTFLKNDRSISAGNLEALHALGSKNILRVVATGRNMQKVSEVIHSDVPFDFIVYSSGAGIYNWKDKKHIYTRNMKEKSANRLIVHFVNKKYSFYVFAAAPDNHNLWYHKGNSFCDEFNRYLSYHNSNAKPLPEGGRIKEELCQFMLIIPEDEHAFTNLKTEIESLCSEIRVIRSSSPVTSGFIWVEIFHHSVSKGYGVNFLCNMLDIHPDETCGVGNDYNDIDLLEFTACSFITENAPNEIRNRFIKVPSNEEDGFATVVRTIL
ncbi:MAG: HAD-IIB family hydrolase [Prolixibacteraceae bacterium]|nr:HAD-IIB family hydrolase [Prolixibacteraceae bacterium]MDD4755127.1 HAD-IIB family hydrolase [Prolixibacteraceae bacterium]NLO03087.1 HAD family phosphatase [Bacteroidales bacterium]